MSTEITEHFADVNGVNLAYLAAGPEDGPVVTLVHGFASNAHVNWQETGWIRYLARASYRVIAPDNRGHGRSDKFYRRDDYSIETMARDVVGLWDVLNIGRSYVVGYSMGARISLRLASLFPHRALSLSIGGNGDGIIRDRSGWQDIANALLAGSDDDPVVSGQGQVFRTFAQRTGSDLPALAACVLGALQPFTAEMIRAIDTDVLIAVGTKDDVAGDPQALADLMLRAKVLHLEGKNHMSAVGDRDWKNETLAHFGS
ncbi:MAG: alpha/beta hydrolase [Pseudomonadota bacterium]